MEYVDTRRCVRADEALHDNEKVRQSMDLSPDDGRIPTPRHSRDTHIEGAKREGEGQLQVPEEIRKRQKNVVSTDCT